MWFQHHGHGMLDNSHLYTVYEMQRTAMHPVKMMASYGRHFHGSSLNPLAYTKYGRKMAAGFELLERLTHNYPKPEFGIKHVKIGSRTVDVKEKIIKKKTFCNLLHFKKDIKKKQPKLLIVAPMSGHFATLLRGTVHDLLPFVDVYITDWLDAKEIPLSKGHFDLDDYIEYVMEFIKVMGKNTHVMAVCQPSVPVMAAASLMATDENPYAPASMTLIGGPIDVRKNPTEVNKVATERPDIWFERNVITRVPFNYAGFMRKVYPGFVQLTGFVSMNMERHVEAHVDLFHHLVDGDGESATAHKKFYNEYLSVMDITAEFYLQTIKTVFKDFDLPLGKMKSRGRPIRPQDIKKTAVLAIEGGKDDISGVGQTKAAITLCENLAESKKKYHLQKDVGHYGTFNGRRFRDQIVPVIVDFIEKNNKK